MALTTEVMHDVEKVGSTQLFSVNRLFQYIILTCFHFQTLAEKAAWDFVAELGEAEKFELSVINPVYIVGPALSGGVSTSQEVRQLLIFLRQVFTMITVNFDGNAYFLSDVIVPRRNEVA